MATRPVVQNASAAMGQVAANNASNAARTQGAASTAAIENAPGASVKDKPRGAHKDAAEVSISSAAKERADAMKRAADIARNTPDVREDRVAALKAQIDAGTYQIDSGKIADGMMREALLDHLAESDER